MTAPTTARTPSAATLAAPALSLDELRQRWFAAVAAWNAARHDGATEEELLDLEWRVDRAYRSYERQERRIKLAVAAGKGFWQ